jgi:hypothetical protein
VARAASFCITNPGWTLEEVCTPGALHQWAVLPTTTTKPMVVADVLNGQVT